MKSIKITQENAVEIEAALKAINGRSNAHCYTSFSVISALAANAEQALESKGVPKKARNGCVWIETSGSPVSKACAKVASKRNATCVMLERKSGRWHLINATLVTIWQEGGGKGTLRLSEAAKAHIKSL